MSLSFDFYLPKHASISSEPDHIQFQSKTNIQKLRYFLSNVVPHKKGNNERLYFSEGRGAEKKPGQKTFTK